MATVLIILVTVLFSIYGFNNEKILNRYSFSLYHIRQYRQWERIFTSTFLHVDYFHLFFNLFSFYSFAILLERIHGSFFVLAMFFLSALGGDLWAWFVHRKQTGYRAVGASGAVSGVIFSAVLLLPQSGIYVFPLPISIPGWLFAMLFISISLFGIGQADSRIGHAAHLGGAITGLFITLLFYPFLLPKRLLIIILMLIPIFVYLVYKKKKPF
ncbi:MAG: rhomboid family intramembrane serine protease [Calditrichia bacterium]